MGGRLLHWMDIAAAISSHRHCGRIVVTASVNNVSFNKAIPRGSIVTLEAKVSRALITLQWRFLLMYGWKTELLKDKIKCNEAIYTFVAVDQLGKSHRNSELIPETKKEKERYEGALRRRQLKPYFIR